MVTRSVEYFGSHPLPDLRFMMYDPIVNNIDVFHVCV